MGLDVERPDPPDLTNRGFPREFDATELIDGEKDFRREEIEEILGAGAWNEAFNEWAEYTDLTEAEYGSIREAGLIERLDFFWDPVEERLRFDVPPLPEGRWDRTAVASKITAELTDLGRTVIEMIEVGYVDWDEEGTADVFWRDAMASEEPPPDD